jgi:ribosomal protein L40E
VSPEDQSFYMKKSNYYTSKKCPSCYVHLPLDARSCTACKSKVGDVDKLGFAEKPIDWQGYLIAAVLMAGFAFFTWWAFFRE